MLDEKLINDEKIDIDDIEENDESEINLIPATVSQEQRSLIDAIIESDNKKELQEQFDLFKMNQSKKNAVRLLKLNSLLDKLDDELADRIDKRPDQISNKDLIDFINVVSNQTEKAQKSIDSITNEPVIQGRPENNQVNINNINIGPQLSRDSKERVMDAIAVLLKQVENSTKNEEFTEAIIIDDDQEDDE